MKYFILMILMTLSIFANASPALCLKDQLTNKVLNHYHLTLENEILNPNMRSYQIIAHSSHFQFTDITTGGIPMPTPLAIHLINYYVSYCKCTVTNLYSTKIVGVCDDVGN